MKKATICFCMVSVLTVCMCGCAGGRPQDRNGKETTVEYASENAGLQPGGEEDGETALKADVEVSDRSAAVLYTGESFMKSAFAVGGTMLYVCGIKSDGEYFLGGMRREEAVFQEYRLDMGEGMRAYNMAVDENERCHILWMSVEKYEAGDQSADRITYERSCITILDSSGGLEKEVDVTDLFSSGYRRPFCFTVDEAGNYYFENGKEIVQITNDGEMGEIIVCDGWVEGIGTGKSGAVYCICRQENEETRVGRIAEGKVYSYGLQLQQSPAAYAGIYAGTDSELLIFNKETGVFACDESYTETRVSGTELPVRGSGIMGYGILADGRVCLMEQKEEGMVFHYIPAGK